MVPSPTRMTAAVLAALLALPGAASAQEQGGSAPGEVRVGVSMYLLDGVYDNLTRPFVPGRDLPSLTGMTQSGLFPETGLPGMSQQVRVLDGHRTLLFQNIYKGHEAQRPALLTVDDFLERTRGEQARRKLVDGFLEKRRRSEREPGSGSLLEFEIPITVPKGLSSVVGEGGAGLRISGNRNIRFAGRSEWTEGAVSTATAYQTKFPSLNMEQQSRFAITGNVGDKIEVQVEQDSNALTDLENNIVVSYRGYEDEILQEVVAGNTDFSLPGSQFLGFNQGARGLFGVKGRARIGDLQVTALASQEKGSGEKATFRAGARESTIRRPDIEPLVGTYYFLDPIYRENWADDPGRAAASEDSITAISVFIDDQDYTNDVEDAARANSFAFVDPDNPQSVDSREAHLGAFHELESDQYYINRSIGILALNRSLGSKDVLGVIYETASGARFGAFPTGEDAEEGLTLKMIRPENPRPEDLTWDLELRNVYYLGSKNIPAEGFKLKIRFDPPSGEDEYTQDGTDYLQILGLDEWGETPDAPPDGNIDLNENFLNLARGELIFPDLEPFMNEELETKVEMYDIIDRQQLTQRSRYYLEIQLATRAASYTLPVTNILENSEVVTLNGRRLRKGTDYQINYLTGELRFLTDEIQDPSADVQVDYEYSPLIQLEQKSLMGLRAEYNLGRAGTISGMVVSRSEQTLDQRIRLGREPNRNIVYDATAVLGWEPEWLTRAMDALPGVRTDARSTLQVEAEFAQNDPDPNTGGEALVDDFEGSKNATDFGIGRGRWNLSSPPSGKNLDERARLVWFNPYERIDSRKIWPEKETDIRSSQVNVLTLAFLPGQPASYPAGRYLWGQVPLEDRWAGIQQAVSAGAADLSKLTFLEVWVNGREGRLHIDLGTVSEDMNENQVLDSEDQLRNGVRNGVLDAGEDIGIDGRTDEEELDYYLVRAGENPDGLSTDQKKDRFTELYVDAYPDWYGSRSADDPANDNFRYGNRDVYDHINGTQGNQTDPDRLGRPDTEDLNGNGYLDRSSDYFTYTVDLSPDSPDTALVAGGDDDPANWDQEYESWRLYRIPISSPSGQTGSPDLSLVESIRLWVDGAQDSTRQARISIAGLDVVGNLWRKSPLVDQQGVELPEETLQVSVRNTFDNPEYEPPPGVVPIRDRVTNLAAQEQSLALTFTDLPPGVEGEVFSTRTRAEDFTMYQGLALFLHGPDGGEGEPAWWTTSDTSYVEAFLRFGADADNYYEYRTRIYPGWDERNHSDVDFQAVTELKQAALEEIAGTSGVVDTTAGNYRVKGRPSLTNIKRLAIGVVNLHPTLEVTGEVWADELRVTRVRRDSGSAARVAIHSDLADVASVDFRLNRQTADFHGLREKRGSQSTNTNSTLAVKSNLDKFTPASWGLVIPLSINWRSSLTLPKRLPGSDLVLDTEEERHRNRTAMDDQSISISLRKQTESENPLMAWTLDRMDLSWTGSRREGVSTVNPVNRSFQIQGRFGYDLTPRSEAEWHPFRAIPLLPESLKETTFNPIPTDLRYSLNATQLGEHVADRSGQERDRYAFTATENYNLGMRMFDPMRTAYSLTLNRDLTDDWSLGDGDLGAEVGRRQVLDSVYEPDLFRWMTQRYQYTSEFRENNDPRYNTRVARQQDGTTREVQLGRDVVLNVDASADYTIQPAELVGRPEPDEGVEGLQRPINDLKKLVQTMSPVILTLTREKTANEFNLSGRPDLSYQLGFSDRPGVTRTSASATQQSQARDTRRIEVRSGLNLPIQAFVDLGPQWRWVDQASESRTIYSQAVTWPAVNVRYTGLQQIRPFADLTRSLSLSSGFRKTDENTDRLSDEGGTRLPYSGRVSRGLEPLISIQMTLNNGMAVMLNSSNVTTVNTQYDPAGHPSSQSVTGNSGLRVSLNYQFTAPQGIDIPLIGQVRFQSQLDMGITLARNRNETRVRIYKPRQINVGEGLIQRTVYEPDEFVPTVSQATWSFQPNIRYNFSRRVQGGLDATFENVDDRLMNRTRKVREVAIFVNLLFN
ncbi:MAG: cell surface protein SprA [bacterium]